MLSTSNSSIQQRRQTHRRQQSLETPILATPLPRYQRAHAHRRGLSLDHSMSMLTSPIELSTIAGASQYPGRHTVSIPQDQQDTQHILQETQQHIPSQPGQIALDFSTHLQRQINGMEMPLLSVGDVPQQQIEVHPQRASNGIEMSLLNAAEAQQQLQNHISWFQATYGQSLPAVTVIAPSAAQQASSQMQIQSHTVPNTPQRHRLQSPAPSKHSRSQSFQYDATPLPQTAFGDPFSTNAYGIPSEFNFDDQSYASSNYSSSIADPMSPPQFSSAIMPTVPEEDDYSMNLLRAAEPLSDDEHDLHAPQPYSPRQAALLALGDINASIEETGISADQVNRYMSEQNLSDSKWTCLYPECGKKFGRKENIRAHVQTHLGDRQFRCNDCGKCFVRQHDLKRHAKIHSGVKPNVCPCGMSFARQDALTRHRQRGTCFGVLPGFEKNEDDKKKRGRPRKERPDLETRVEKAVRARRLDAATARYAASISSDSGVSDHSSPLTPAPSSDIDDMLFNDFVTNSGVPFTMHSDGSWLVDTPPTSPASYHTLPKTIAPTMLSNHPSPEGSSPASMDDVELALLAWRGDDREVVY